MNKLPKCILEKIIYYTFDRRGYNTIEYEINKQNNKHNMNRIRLELYIFFQKRMSITWLKSSHKQKKKNSLFIYYLKNGYPLVLYNTGLYTTYNEEMDAIKICGKYICSLK
jgi:hypothetical protein